MQMNDRKPFYKYVPAEVAKIILINKTLRWSSPLLFDDRYDVARELASGIEPSKMNQYTIDYLHQLAKNGNVPNDLNSHAKIILALFKIAQSKGMLDTVIKELGSLETSFQSLIELKKIWEGWLPEFRILCLSAANDIPLMWERYADSYRGIVLEFSSLKEFEAPWLLAKPVLYEDRTSLLDKLDKAGWGKLLTLNQEEAVKFLFNESCYTKMAKWAYQKEWRVISFKREHESSLFSDYHFYPQTLSAIYFGQRISSKDKEDIQSLLKYDLSHVKANQIINRA
jgi:hypothetical protein